MGKLEESLQFYSKREKNGSVSQKRWGRLRDFRDQSDAEAYTPILKEVLGLFGKGIHESLSRTMGDFLEATNGTQSSSKVDAWVRERCRGMVATNNNAERPFAVVKLFHVMYPSMTLRNMRHLSHSRCNGTYARASEEAPKTKKTAGKTVAKPAGAALTADPRLKAAISKVCSVRSGSLGSVTKLTRGQYASDIQESAAHLEQSKKKKLNDRKRTAAKSAQKRDAAHTVVLIETLALVDVELSARAGVGAKREFLSQQIDARIVGRATEFEYSLGAVPIEYRSLHFKKKPIKKSPPSGQNEVVYMARLVKLMIKDDISNNRYTAGALNGAEANTVTYARDLPVISEQHTCDFSKALIEKGKQENRDLMVIQDDEQLVALDEKYVGKLLYDDEDKETYKARAIQSRDWGKDKEIYVATVIRVQADSSGEWTIPKDVFVGNTDTIKIDELECYFLMDITDENNPIFFPEVDGMITAHEKREADAAAGAAEENGEGEINNDAAKRRKNPRDL